MKKINKKIVIFIGLIICSNTYATPEKTDNPTAWQKAIDKRIIASTNKCKKTEAFQRYELESQIEKDYKKIKNLKTLFSMKGITNEKEFQTNIKPYLKSIMQNYASYKKLGGATALSEVRQTTNPCAQPVSDELLDISYTAPSIDALFLHRVHPVYPKRELIRGKTGTVVVDFIVDTKGKAKHIKVIDSTSNLFTLSATKALRESTFHVSMKDGKPYEHKARTSFYFKLGE